MKRHILVLGLATVLAAPAPAFAQAPPPNKPPVSPKAEQNDACARTTLGQGGDVDDKRDKAAQDKTLSDKLARSNGVICPPSHVDPDMKQPPPQSGGNMPVITPPGSPGGNEQIQPK